MSLASLAAGPAAGTRLFAADGRNDAHDSYRPHTVAASRDDSRPTSVHVTEAVDAMSALRTHADPPHVGSPSPVPSAASGDAVRILPFTPSDASLHRSLQSSPVAFSNLISPGQALLPMLPLDAATAEHSGGVTDMHVDSPHSTPTEATGASPDAPNALCASPVEFAFPEPALQSSASIADLSSTIVEASQSSGVGVHLEPYRADMKASDSGHTLDVTEPESVPPYLYSSPAARSAASSVASSAGTDSDRAAAASFSSSSFLADAVASPPPSKFDALVGSDSLDSVRMQFDDSSSGAERDDDDDDMDESDEAESEDLERRKDSYSPISPQLNEPVASIGDVSLQTSGGTSTYHPMLLQEDFAGVKMQDDTTMLDGVTAASAGRVGRKKPPPLSTAQLHKTLPSTPVTRPKRLQQRRNSEAVPTSAAAAAAAHAPLHSLLPSTVAAAMSTATQRRATYPLSRPVSHKRKSLPSSGDKDGSALPHACEQCESCPECARHWSSHAGLKNHPTQGDHGHVHSKPSAPNSPLVKALGVNTHAPVGSEPMLISPAHAPMAASGHARHIAGHGHGGALSHKPNYAMRTGSSINDAALALSPALCTRRLHHRMLAGHWYEVGSLLDVRLRGREVWFKVRWAGFPDLFDSWEPMEGLQQNCARLIEEFEEENGRVEVGVGGESEGDEQPAAAAAEDDEYLTAVAAIRPPMTDTDEEHAELASSSPTPLIFTSTASRPAPAVAAMRG